MERSTALRLLLAVHARALALVDEGLDDRDLARRHPPDLGTIKRGMSDDRFVTHRSLLFTVAYEMLGSELLGHLATGADTRQTAERVFLSEHTVQDHLKAIFARTGAPNRRVLLTRAKGR